MSSYLLRVFVELLSQVKPCVRTLSIMTLASACTASWSATVPSFTTGVNDDGSFVSLGSADPHWEVVAGPGITTAQPAVVLTAQRNPLGTYYTTTDSQWIWVTASGQAGVNSPYTFELTFDLTGYDPSTTVIAGKWGVDNVASIDINGAPATGSGELALTNPSNFVTPNPFSVTGPFHSGVNTIDIMVTDFGFVGGLDVTALAISATPVEPIPAVPEPTVVALMAMGMVAVAFAGRRRSRTNIS